VLEVMGQVWGLLAEMRNKIPQHEKHGVVEVALTELSDEALAPRAEQWEVMWKVYSVIAPAHPSVHSLACSPVSIHQVDNAKFWRHTCQKWCKPSPFGCYDCLSWSSFPSCCASASRSE
jgi:hypothetical protein